MMKKHQPYQKFCDKQSLLEYKMSADHQQMPHLEEDSEDRETERLCCWDIWRRGSMGETLLHVCLLCGSKIARELVFRLLKLFPLLALDVYLSNDYYGQSAVHMALVNEDLVLLKFMLDLSQCHPFHPFLFPLPSSSSSFSS